MRLILFRHAPAEARDPERWPDDLLRPLTSRGEERARRAARGIAWLESGPVTVMTSPASRARATAQILADAFDEPHEPQAMSSLAPGGSWRETLRALALVPADAHVALVGHEPELGRIAGALLFGPRASVPLKKAGACGIALDSPGVAAGELRWFLSPAVLRALARKGSAA
jgi:phosphohistidine phosphatase